MSTEPESRSVLVTGGSSGIGGAVARAFAVEGCRVISTGVSEAEVASARQDPAFAGIDIRMLDVRDGAAVQALIDSIDALDVLVNCAGTIRRGGTEHDPEVFDEVLAINLGGTMRACAAARAKLAARRGCIVNTASMLSFFGGAITPGYSASKGGVAQLTKSLAIAYAAEGTRVNAVAPGWIATPLTQPLQDDVARAASIVARTPMGRWGTPEDIAGPVLFLASPAARFITGVILPVDGGYLIA